LLGGFTVNAYWAGHYAKSLDARSRIFDTERIEWCGFAPLNLQCAIRFKKSWQQHKNKGAVAY
jgi:hypothetical protein